MENKETLEEAYKSGKTIQCKSSGQWKDFIPQNQLDKPNWEYTGINNWRIKPEESNIISNWLSENRNPEIDKQVNEEAKELQKQHIVDIMKGDEELGLYKETLEEANWKVLDTKTDTFIRGAEWMQERSYSEEDMRTSFGVGMKFMIDNKLSFDEWFEQFKKK